LDERKARVEAAEARDKERRDEFAQRKAEELEIKLRQLCERHPFKEQIEHAQQLLNFCNHNKL